MTRCAQREQVARIIAAASPLPYNVMGDRGGGITAGTLGMISQKPVTDLAPPGIIATFRCCAALRILAFPFLALMLITEAPPASTHQLGTSPVGTSAGGQAGHNSYSSPR